MWTNKIRASASLSSNLSLSLWRSRSPWNGLQQLLFPFTILTFPHSYLYSSKFLSEKYKYELEWKKRREREREREMVRERDQDPSPSSPTTVTIFSLHLNCDCLCRTYLNNNNCLVRLKWYIRLPKPHLITSLTILQISQLD